MRQLLRLLVMGSVLVLTLLSGACGRSGTSAPPGGQGPPAPTSVSRSPASPVASPSSSAASPASASPSVTSPGTPLPPRTLVLGMAGVDVRELQRRLAALHYYPGAADARFGQNTLEALWAFQAVQGLAVTGSSGPATRQALARPRTPGALVPAGGALRVEIDLSRQLLVLYRSSQVALISHISSGGGYYYCSPAGGCGYAVTPTGDFRTTVFLPGWVTVPLGQMYNPVFFIGTAYAIHGSASVPLQPVSHGCLRIPMIVAEFFHRLVPVPGTPVYIRR